MSSEKEQLEKRIQELELEVMERERDLSTYRGELSKVNERLQELITGLNAELKVAQAIQKKLVPTELPNIPGFQISAKFIPSMVKGGDYYDIFEHEDPNRFSVILASSSGYAMSALLLSILLKLTSQMEAYKSGDPAKVIESISKDISESGQAGDRTDILYSVIDRRTFDFSFCLGGDLIALHQDFSTGSVSVLAKTGEALTSESDKSFEVGVKRLNPRDRLLLCSVGVVQASNQQGDKFGLERVVRAVKGAPKRGVHELRNEILYQVESFVGDTESQRDRTVVVLEVKDRVIKLAKK